MTENGAGTKIKTRKRTGTEIANDLDPGIKIETERRDQGQEKKSSQERESVADHVTKSRNEAAVL